MLNHAKTHLCKHISNRQSILTKDSFQNGHILQLWQLTQCYPSKRFRNWRVHKIGIVEKKHFYNKPHFVCQNKYIKFDFQ